jgi:hypothetical protein
LLRWSSPRCEKDWDDRRDLSGRRFLKSMIFVTFFWNLASDVCVLRGGCYSGVRFCNPVIDTPGNELR